MTEPLVGGPPVPGRLPTSTAVAATVPGVLAVKLRQLDPGLPTPRYARPGDAGADLSARAGAALEPAGGRAVIPTGVSVEIPDGFAGLILPRSGLARHHGITCLNAPGLIDSGYRGELEVLLVNTDPHSAYRVERGDRIAQLVIIAHAAVSFVSADVLSDSDRGTDGWGHTGR